MSMYKQIWRVRRHGDPLGVGLGYLVQTETMKALLNDRDSLLADFRNQTHGRRPRESLIKLMQSEYLLLVCSSVGFRPETFSITCSHNPGEQHMVFISTAIYE